MALYISFSSNATFISETCNDLYCSFAIPTLCWLLLINDNSNIFKYVNKVIIPNLIIRGRPGNEMSYCWAENKGTMKYQAMTLGRESI